MVLAEKYSLLQQKMMMPVLVYVGPFIEKKHSEF